MATKRNYEKISSEKKETLLTQVTTKDFTIREVSDLLGIKYSTARNLVARYKKYGQLEVDQLGRRHKAPIFNQSRLEQLDELVEHNGSFSIKEIQQWFYEHSNKTINAKTITQALGKLKITKRRFYEDEDEIDNTEIEEKKIIFAKDFFQNAPKNKARCVFVDHCLFVLHLKAPKKKPDGKGTKELFVPTSQGRKATLILAMNDRSVIHHQILEQAACTTQKIATFFKDLFVKLNERKDLENCWILTRDTPTYGSGMLDDTYEKSKHMRVFLPPSSKCLNPVDAIFTDVKFQIRGNLNDEELKKSFTEIIEDGIDNLTEKRLVKHFINFIDNISLESTATIFKREE